MYLSYERPKYLVEMDFSYSLRFSTLFGIRHVAIILLNTIFCHFQPIYPVIPNTQWNEGASIKFSDHITLSNQIVPNV